MTSNVVDLTGDFPSESLLEYLNARFLSEADVLTSATKAEPEIVDLTEMTPSPSVASIFGVVVAEDPSSRYEKPKSPTIKQEPGIAAVSRFIAGSTTHLPLHRLDSISEDTPVSSLHRLPPEIRLIIYGYVLTAPSNLTHRIPNESPLTQRLPISEVTTIMRTSKALCEETKKVFYSTNRFHHDKDEPFSQWPPQFFMNLPFMKHVSLSYTDDYLAAFTPNERFLERIDCVLGSLITELPEFAPNLCTFTLSILSAPAQSIGYRDVLLPRGTRTGIALRKLRNEVDRVSIIAFGPPAALQNLRNTIAPKAEWSENIIRTWPQFNIPRMQQLTMMGRRGGLDGNEHIRVWHLYNGASRVARKPLDWEGELFGTVSRRQRGCTRKCCAMHNPFD